MSDHASASRARLVPSPRWVEREVARTLLFGRVQYEYVHRESMSLLTAGTALDAMHQPCNCGVLFIGLSRPLHLCKQQQHATCYATHMCTLRFFKILSKHCTQGNWDEAHTRAHFLYHRMHTCIKK